LNDLVSYDHKHNEANGEGNRDGADDNRSWNCGVEGPTDDLHVEKLRNRQVKNFFAATLLSIGTPMILMGDEVRRTQHGNNNAYCHDGELNWFDWSLVDKHADVHRFVTLLNERRLIRSVEHEHRRLTLAQLIQQANKSWHGVRVGQPDWSPGSHCMVLNVELKRERRLMHLIMNAYWEPLDVELPREGRQSPWRRWIDTALDSPQDIVSWQSAPSMTGPTYRIQPRSVVLIFSDLEAAPT
jgi:glycogen operon protein